MFRTYQLYQTDTYDSVMNILMSAFNKELTNKNQGINRATKLLKRRKEGER